MSAGVAQISAPQEVCGSSSSGTHKQAAEFPRAGNSALPKQADAKTFWTFAEAGKKLARLHIDYEKLEPYPLKFVETPTDRATQEKASGVAVASASR